jgi:hypothetical protein
MRNHAGTIRHAAVIAASLLLSCDVAEQRIEDDGRQLDMNDPGDAKLCKQRGMDYDDFLDQHSSCESDEDCAVVGNCGPHASFDAVRADAVEEAMLRKLKLCENTYDGPVFKPVCRANKCEMSAIMQGCCGCASE